MPSAAANPTPELNSRRFTDDILDDVMAEVLRGKEPAEKLAIASKLWIFARDLLAENLRREHPEWDEEMIRSQVARRLSHGSV